jgi:peptide/nickel transport system substrate-binding protein
MSTKISRRDFLKTSALIAGSTLLVSCTQKTTTEAPVAPTATLPEPTKEPEPTKLAQPTIVKEETPIVIETLYKEAPMLEAKVAAGELPPVDERLPENPRVVKHGWQTPGVYGGMMQTAVSFEWGLTYFPVEQFCYGSAPIQYKDDGLLIVPGTLESFEINDAATEVVLHWRKGLKWSDGTPWSMDDFMFWWEDMCLNPDYFENAPGGLLDGTGKVATITQMDDFSIKVTYDIPTPLAIDNFAMGVKGIWGGEWYGVPKHYFSQFHPKYNTALTDYSQLEGILFYGTNADMPTLNAWVVRTYEQGQRVVWERNPYYYCIDEGGNQLPYMDGFVNTNFMSGDVEKLAYLEGKIDFGFFNPFNVVDVPSIRESKDKSNLVDTLWASGTGTSFNGFVFCYDYYEDKFREVFRNPKFRKALSHAINRVEIQKIHYLGFGELTTGTMAPQAIEFNINDEGRQWYAAWRDSAVTYDPEKAKTLLDEAGLLDVDGDGFREFSDGSKMRLSLDYQGAQGDSVGPIEMEARDWQAVGLDVYLNPVPPDSFRPQYDAGKLMSWVNYDASDGPNCIIFPAHIVPSGSYGWAPLEGRYYTFSRSQVEKLADVDKSPWDRTEPWMEPEPGGPIEKLQLLLDQAKLEPDPMKRYKIVYDMIKIHIEDGPFMIGLAANTPQVIVFKEDVKNVPTEAELKKYALGGFTGPWIIPAPGTYDPECWYFTDPEAHA